MHSKLLKFSLCLVLAGAFIAQAAYSQDVEPTDTGATLSPVEDTTLDNSNAAAADAANSVPAAPEPTGQSDAAPASAPAAEAPAIEQPAAAATENQPESSTAQDTEKNKTAESAEQAETAQKAEDAEEAEEAEEVKAAEAAPEKALPAKVADTGPKTDSSIKGTYGGRVFGRYRIQIAGNKPTFNEGQKCYDKLYGKPQTYFSMAGDWFPLDWWINPGITMKMGSYSARGKAVSGVVESSQITSCDQLTVDNNSKTTLLFMPIQLGAKIQITPFRRKWLVVDVWGAGEYGWWQETRDSASSFVSPFGLLAADSPSSTSNKTYTNTGRRPAVSTGASVHLLLNYLDEQTVRSMVDSMGIGYVYLSGFAENVKSRTKTGLSFGRQVVGVGFTFETFK